MKSLFFTKEYPPNVYGGAGVHVDYLSRALASICEVEVRCFGDQDESSNGVAVKGYEVDASDWSCPEELKSVLDSIAHGTEFNVSNIDADLVHVHTWYAHWAGIMAKLNYGIPLVVTVHSLEPLRPWKREQLGGGYDFSCWVEKTAIEMADAVIAVSEGTKAEVLEYFDVDESMLYVIYNGVDMEEYQPASQEQVGKVLGRYGIDESKPYVLFVGRVTRQKGIIHLVNAISKIDPNCQVVLCAGAPDTEEVGKEMAEAVEKAREIRDGVFWIDEMIDVESKIALYSGAAVFCSPSIYEPFGIINLEAMACGTAVVASAVGGQKEVVVDGVTGRLVDLDQSTESPFEASDPTQYATDLAGSINELIQDKELREYMAIAGRKRAEELFSWKSIAEQTKELYEKLCR